ncbi:hypothetical protein GA0115256_103514 [Streptomyces sp. DconLS]|nr:hypothetical protein GA0115258_10093 [Streptomyces sp. LamerLS-31b]SCF59078.1 hypothetical protein GA0115256_103514 [Streptomyces sp. DconLS]
MSLAECQKALQEKPSIGMRHVMGLVDHNQTHILQSSLCVLPQGMHEPLRSKNFHIGGIRTNADGREVGLVVAELAAQNPQPRAKRLTHLSSQTAKRGDVQYSPSVGSQLRANHQLRHERLACTGGDADQQPFFVEAQRVGLLEQFALRRP